MNFAYYFVLFQRVMKRFFVARVLVFDKFCVFILNLSVIFYLFIDNTFEFLGLNEVFLALEVLGLKKFYVC